MMTTWDIFREMDAMKRDMDSLFRAYGSGSRRPAFKWSFLPGRAARAYPLLNLSEDNDNVYVQALAPGLDPKSLDITVVRDQITLSGEKPAADGKEIKAEAYHRNERAAGRFTRSFTLPAEVDQNKAKANYENGILSVTLPKSEQAKPKQISVKVG